MPQRFLRPGIRNSERWNAVDWRQQSLYIRLMTLVDDYGRCDGRPAVLWGECWQVWNEKHPEQAVSVQDTQQMLQQMSTTPALLIDWYEESGKQVVQITQWQERIRDGVKERWPAKTSKSRLLQDLQQNLLPSPPSSPPSSPPPPAVGSEKAGGGDVELPPGFPATVDDAIRQSQNCGLTVDFVTKTWDKAVSRGGTDSKQVPIRSWAHYVKAEWNYEQDRIAREAARNGKSSSAQQRIDRNIGTANEGAASQYRHLGRVARDRDAK